MVGVNIDVTDQRQSETELREARDALTLATQASHLGWATWDFTTGAMTWDDRGRDIMDLCPSENTVEDWQRRVPQDDQDALRTEVRRSYEARQPFDLIYRVRRRDGSERRIHGTGTIRLDADGTPLGGTGLVRDVTEQWRETEFQKLVIGELNHRVKNLLSLVNALVTQTGTAGRTAEEYQATLSGRLDALGAISSIDLDTTTDTVDLKDLVEAVLAPHRIDRSGAVILDGSRLRLPMRHGRMIGLALHELATNATKYGALSSPAGTVCLAWRAEDVDGEPCLFLSWQEQGGPTVFRPQRSGFGSRLLQQVVASETGGSAELGYEADGVTYELTLPLT